MRNRYGLRGSPCLRPRQHWIPDPGTPLSMIAVFPVDRREDTMARHPSPKPRAASTVSRDAHEMKSKALRKSSLRTMVGAPRLWQHWMSLVANMELSMMFLPQMKPVCRGETRSVMCACNLVVRILAAIFGAVFWR